MLAGPVRLLVALTVVMVLALTAGATDARASVAVGIGKVATLVAGGGAVDVEVEVACSPSHQVLEAFVYVVQDGQQSQFAGIPVRCTGQPRTYIARVQAYPDQLFHTGDAYASAYVLTQDRATGKTESGGAAGTISIR